MDESRQVDVDKAVSNRDAALAQMFVVLADTLVDDFDVTDLFDRLTGACVELLNASTAGLMLVDRSGTLQLVASSSEAMRVLEQFEMATSEGPCIECFSSATPVAADLSTPEAARRWPVFTPEALQASVLAVQALPMRLRGQVIGALNIFYNDTHQLSGADVALAQALADIATIALLQQRALSSSELLTAQLQQALNDRVTIEHVKGLLAERGQLDVDSAFNLLRRYCRSARLPMARTARELLSGRRDPDDVLEGRRSPEEGPDAG